LTRQAMRVMRGDSATVKQGLVKKVGSASSYLAENVTKSLTSSSKVPSRN